MKIGKTPIIPLDAIDKRWQWRFQKLFHQEMDDQEQSEIQDVPFSCRQLVPSPYSDNNFEKKWCLNFKQSCDALVDMIPYVASSKIEAIYEQLKCFIQLIQDGKIPTVTESLSAVAGSENVEAEETSAENDVDDNLSTVASTENDEVEENKSVCDVCGSDMTTSICDVCGTECDASGDNATTAESTRTSAISFPRFSLQTDVKTVGRKRLPRRNVIWKPTKKSRATPSNDSDERISDDSRSVSNNGETSAQNVLQICDVLDIESSFTRTKFVLDIVVKKSMDKNVFFRDPVLVEIGPHMQLKCSQDIFQILPEVFIKNALRKLEGLSENQKTTMCCETPMGNFTLDAIQKINFIWTRRKVIRQAAETVSWCRDNNCDDEFLEHLTSCRLTSLSRVGQTFFVCQTCSHLDMQIGSTTRVWSLESILLLKRASQLRQWL